MGQIRPAMPSVAFKRPSVPDLEEFNRFASEVSAPLLANMTEFGRGPLLTVSQLAELGYAVIGVDSNYDRVKKLNAGIPPIFEPGLEELIKKNLTSGRLSYNSDFEKSVQNARNCEESARFPG